MKLLLLILLSTSQAQAGRYQEYIDAKKDALAADQDYLEYVRAKKIQAAENERALEAFKRERELREWSYEQSRLRFIDERDAKARQPASVLEADERVYERELAGANAEKERDRRRHVYSRELREWVRQEVDAHAVSPELRRRNEKPWDEF
jgi:hypothetical protein